MPSSPACGLRRWRFPRAEAEAAATLRPHPRPSRPSCGVAAQAPTSPASPTLWPSCCSVVTWTQFPPSCLLPSLGSARGLPCQFPKASPPGSHSCLSPHPYPRSPTSWNTPAPLPFSPTHRESLGPSAHFPFGSWLNIGSPWLDCEFPSPG